MKPTLRPWLTSLAPYVPGAPAADPRGALASNESCFGPSLRVGPALTEAVGGLNRYPDPTASGLREALAAHHDVHPDQILVGDGSDELIYLLSMAYSARGRIVCAAPAYRLDELATTIVGGEVTSVPLVDHHHDLTSMAGVEADIAYVVNPHNPTGTALPSSEIAGFVDRARASLVVVDEAYIHFADPAYDSMALARDERAVVLRTFSKAYGLAGARVGYLVGPRGLVDELRRIRAPFSVTTPSQVAALAALGDTDHLAHVVSETRRLRGELEDVLRDAGMTPVPSHTNFVLCEVDDERAVVARLAAGGVSVRPGSNLGAPGTVRITVPGDEGLELVRQALA